jgi:hypothetical protein
MESITFFAFVPIASGKFFLGTKVLKTFLKFHGTAMEPKRVDHPKLERESVKKKRIRTDTNTIRPTLEVRASKWPLCPKFRNSFVVK